ncbi:hypothetical protein CPB83DRAFT_104940 [Crepidotus variabilis]|uniref:Transmembrane protein n=1 Tax=Crepidotus variabilis TaxID=179855 RepID=A0A9P6JSK5_9AGAR|nr:hypothetical protein CPB83DRAFT_104940 [Crepidotus variabilis]
MRDWKSSEELSRDAVIMGKVVNVWLGVYFWEVLTSMSFEVDFIKKKRAFQLQVVPYFISRYCEAIGLLCCVILLNSATQENNCNLLYAVSFFLEISVVCANINFALRTMVIWNHRTITSGLWIMVWVHIALVLLNTIQFKAVWHPVGGCVSSKVDRSYRNLLLLRTYTMAFDATVLLLGVYKLAVDIRRKGRGSLVRCLLGQGLAYFVIGLVCNAIAVGFLIWKPNVRLGIIGSTPATVFTVIAASRCVRYLSDLITHETHRAQGLQLSTVATGPMDFENTSLSREDRIYTNLPMLKDKKESNDSVLVHA